MKGKKVVTMTFVQLKMNTKILEIKKTIGWKNDLLSQFSSIKFS